MGPTAVQGWGRRDWLVGRMELVELESVCGAWGADEEVEVQVDVVVVALLKLVAGPCRCTIGLSLSTITVRYFAGRPHHDMSH